MDRCARTAACNPENETLKMKLDQAPSAYPFVVSPMRWRVRLNTSRWLES